MTDNLQVNNQEVNFIDSLEVANMTGKRHDHLLRDIRVYIGYLSELDISSSDYFIESSYTDAKGESRACFLITSKGCGVISNSMTAKKGILFTVSYVKRFEGLSSLENKKVAGENE